MPEISTARKFGLMGRVAARQAGQNRLLRAGYHAVSVTTKHFARVIHLLWLQITGVFFLFFGLAGAGACWNEYHKWQAGISGAAGKMILAACFALLFFWFGISSFQRANHRAAS